MGIYFIASNLHTVTYQKQAKSSPAINGNKVSCKLTYHKISKGNIIQLYDSISRTRIKG